MQKSYTFRIYTLSGIGEKSGSAVHTFAKDITIRRASSESALNAIYRKYPYLSHFAELLRVNHQ